MVMAGLKALGIGQLAAGAAAALAVIAGGGVWWSTQRPSDPPEAAATVETAVPAAAEEQAAVAAAAEPAVEAADTIAVEPSGEPAMAEPAAAEPAAAEPAAAEPAAAEPAAAEPAAAEPAATEPAAPAVSPPSFDVVRVDPDGNALIAGQAAAGSAVSVRIDETEAASATTDSQGKFVAMFAVPPADVPRIVTLMMRMENGTEMAGAGSVILAPTAAKPTVVAEATAPESDEVTTAEPTTTEAALEPAAEPEKAEEPEAPAVLMADDQGLKVLQPAGDALAQNVVIDTISYDQNGTVLLAGRGAGGSGLQIYLDNAALAATTIAADDTWSTPLPEIKQGLYTLRVDQVDAAGKVTSRYETPFKREDPAALANLGTGQTAADVVVAEAATAEPAAEPTMSEPAAKEPDAAEPASVEPAAPEPAAPEPAAPEPAAPEPAAPEPAIADSTTAEPPTTEPAAAETEPASAEPAATAAAAADPVAASAEPARAPDPAEAPAAPEEVASTDVAADPAQPASEPVASATIAEVAEPAPEPTPEPVAEGPRVTIVTVQPGFTLWQIASEAYGEGVMYVQVWDANKDKIRNPDLIYPGQVFLVPEPPKSDGN